MTVIQTLKESIRVLDGYEVSSREKRASKKKMDKLKVIVKGKEKFFKEFVENLPEDEDLDRLELNLSARDETPESPFRDWKPVSRPLSTLSTRRTVDFDASEEARIEIATPYKDRRH
jgi:hypothetical protein